MGTNNSCIPCNRGYYKDSTMDVFSNCTQCPLGRGTPFIGATSEDDCSLRRYRHADLSSLYTIPYLSFCRQNGTFSLYKRLLKCADLFYQKY